MKNKLLLGFALVLGGGLLGCSTVKTNHCVETLPESFPWIAFNGKHLLFRNQLWDMNSGRETCQFTVPPQITVSNNVSHGYGYVEAAAFSPDGKKVLTATAQQIAPEMLAPGPVQLWDVASGRKLVEFMPDERINNARFLPDGKRILMTCDGQKYSIQIWDAETGQRLLALPEHPVSLYAAQIAGFSPDGRLLATGSSAGTNGHYYGTVNIRNSITGRRICTIVDTTNSYFDLAVFSPDGKSILTVQNILLKDFRGTITNSRSVATIWDTKHGRRIRDFVHLHPLLFTPDGRKMICTGGQCTIRLREVTSGKEIRQFTIPGSENWWRVGKIALSHDGKRLVVQYQVSSTQTAVALWNMDTGDLIKQFGIEPAMYWGTVVGFSLEDESFMLFGRNGKPALYDGDTGRCLKVLGHFQQP